MHIHHQHSKPVLTFFFLALVFWMPLPLGGNRVWATSIMEIWVFILTAFTCFAIYKEKISLSHLSTVTKPVILLFSAFLLWCLIQILPLFPGIGENEGLQFTSIAIDPARSSKSFILSITLALLLFLTLALINTKQKLAWLAYTIVLSGLFQATYGSFMVLSGLEYSFFFEKEAYRGSATGTFINRNHLAGYLEMCLAVGIGLMISKIGHNENHNLRDYLRSVLTFLLGSKVLIRIALIITCIGLILTHSRMGNSAFFGSLLFCGAIFILISKHATRGTIFFLTSIIVLDIILIGSWVGIEKVVDRIDDTSLQAEQRDEVARDTLTLIAKQPFTGIGGGNYFIALPSSKAEDTYLNYYHAHNDYLEITAEYGLIGTAILGSLLLYSLYLSIQVMRFRHSAIRLGMAFASFMGISSLLIHSTVDFNLQIPANAAMLVILVALSILPTTVKSRHKKHHHYS